MTIEQQQRTYSNPRGKLISTFIPVSMIPGLALFTVGITLQDSVFLILGMFVLVLAPLSMWLTDYFLRPVTVTINQIGVILRFKNQRELAIPFDEIDLIALPSSSFTAYQTRGNIGNINRKVPGKQIYSISAEILAAIKQELSGRGKPQ
jgi:hypothetical protein